MIGDTVVSKSDGTSLVVKEEGESGRLAKEGKLQASNNRNDSLDKSMPAKFGRNRAMVGRLLTPRASQRGCQPSSQPATPDYFDQKKIPQAHQANIENAS